MKRKHAVLIGFLLLVCCTLTACTATPASTAETYEDFIVVGFSQVGAESDWRNANTISMQQALSEANGYRLIIDDAQQKQERQITAIRNFIHQGVDYIVLAPTTEKGWDTVLAEAKDAGIPVIIVDRMIEVSDDSLFNCWIGSDFLGEGRNAVKNTFLQCFHRIFLLKLVHTYITRPSKSGVTKVSITAAAASSGTTPNTATRQR